MPSPLPSSSPRRPPIGPARRRGRGVAVALAAVVVLTAGLATVDLGLAPVAGAAPAGVHAACQQVNRTIAHPTTSTESVFIFEPTGGATAVDGGRCNDNSRPVILFAHGFGARAPVSYAALIQHLTSRGFVVIYPTYPNAGN